MIYTPFGNLVFFLGKRFIHLNTNLTASRQWSSSNWYDLICLVHYDEELEWAVLCAAHPILNIKGGGSMHGTGNQVVQE